MSKENEIASRWYQATYLDMIDLAVTESIRDPDRKQDENLKALLEEISLWNSWYIWSILDSDIRNKE